MNREKVVEIYNLLERIPEIGFKSNKADLPLNGVYFAYEASESVNIGGNMFRRVVRIGSHLGQGNLFNRIRSHYGQVNSLKGNSGRSVFRKLIGAAIIKRENIGEVKLHDWLEETTPEEIEHKVSKYLRDNVTFRCIAIEKKDERLEVESYLISLFARIEPGKQSPGWLGNDSHCPKVRAYGIWNRKDTDGSALKNERWSNVISAFLRTYRYYGMLS